jgi:hypothetical protein
MYTVPEGTATIKAPRQLAPGMTEAEADRIEAERAVVAATDAAWDVRVIRDLADDLKTLARRFIRSHSESCGCTFCEHVNNGDDDHDWLGDDLRDHVTALSVACEGMQVFADSHLEHCIPDADDAECSPVLVRALAK